MHRSYFVAVSARILSFAWIVIALMAVRAHADEPKYVVVDFVGAKDPYYAAATRLSALHSAPIVSADPKKLDLLQAALQKSRPRFVAFVIRPEQLDENLARRILVMATKVDADPFVDFAYGFITGDSPETAVRLVEAAQQAQVKRHKPEIAQVGVAGEMLQQSSISNDEFPLRDKKLPMLTASIAGGGEGPGEPRDLTFIRKVMPQLEGKSIVYFLGHGYPREVVGGPTWKELDGIHLNGAVVVNIACYTGVTGRWFEDDMKTGVVRERKVPAKESFCLNMLRSGVAAYVAYTCVRPSGAELLADIPALAAEGMSVGEAQRADYNRVVLTHLAQGFDGLKVVPVADGQRAVPSGNMTEFLLPASTGGVLFGDPAFTPFDRQEKELPYSIHCERAGHRMTATVSVLGPHVNHCCGDQIETWSASQSPALHVICRIPLGHDMVERVGVTNVKIGDKTAPHRLVWAIEEDGDERFIHVKAVAPMPASEEEFASIDKNGVQATFEITLTDDAAKARLKGIVKNSAETTPSAGVPSAMQLASVGKFTEAEKVLKTVLAKSPKDTNALTLMGMCFMQTNDWASAKSYFEKAIEADGNQLQAMAGLAEALKSQGDIDGAIKVWEQLEAKLPGAPEVTLGLADAYLAKKKYEKAIPLLESLEKALPSDNTIKKKLAKARSAAGK